MAKVVAVMTPQGQYDPLSSIWSRLKPDTNGPNDLQNWSALAFANSYNDGNMVGHLLTTVLHDSSHTNITHLEIVAHGTPTNFAGVDVEDANEFWSQLDSRPNLFAWQPIIILTGCNTGTRITVDPNVWCGEHDPVTQQTAKSNISEALACASHCEVLGTRGYVNAATYAEVDDSVPNVSMLCTRCPTDNQGQLIAYSGSMDTAGKSSYKSFVRCNPMVPVYHYKEPFPGADPRFVERVQPGLEELFTRDPTPYPFGRDPILPHANNPMTARGIAPDGRFEIEVRGRRRSLGLFCNGTFIQDMETMEVWRFDVDLNTRRALMQACSAPYPPGAYTIKLQPATDGTHVATVEEFGNSIYEVGASEQEAIERARAAIHETNRELRTCGLRETPPNQHAFAGNSNQSMTTHRSQASSARTSGSA